MTNENAIAERIKGILKQEYEIDNFNVDLKTSRILVEKAVKKYNKLRPHLSNHYLTPGQMHLELKLKPILNKKTVQIKLSVLFK